jgi:HSP20 family molecular chaperone IbpA
VKETAKKIRIALLMAGFHRLDVSVKQNPDYTISVTTKSPKAKENNSQIMGIVKKVYNEKNHYWLCVEVDGYWLPMPKSNLEAK